jgi:hypothetical protein
MKRSEHLIGLGILTLILLLVTTNTITMFTHPHMNMDEMDMDEHRESFITQKQLIIGELIGKEEYQCCLEKPCTYCIEKTPGHGKGATCSCLADIINGVHPCGECIGEILEGHGNPLLAEYFAKAIAEEVGEQHTDTLKHIIQEKYDFPIEQQF